MHALALHWLDVGQSHIMVHAGIGPEDEPRYLVPMARPDHILGNPALNGFEVAIFSTQIKQFSRDKCRPSWRRCDGLS